MKRTDFVVLTVAMNLTIIAAVVTLARAILEWHNNGRWGFMLIWVAYVALAFFALRPAYRTYRQVNRKDRI